MLNRAYAFLDVKSVDADRRTFAGIATTPTPDRVDDIIEPLGVEFKNPSPLLLYHDSRLPVGEVTFGKPTSKGVPFTATIPDIAEEGTLKERVDEAWQSVKYGLIKAVSIGFKDVKGFVEPLKSGGLRFLKTNVFELSLVVIPANAEAVITTVKSLDAEHLPASGDEVPPVVPPSAGVSASSAKAQTPKKMKSYADRIADCEANLLTKTSDREAIQAKVSEEGRTKDPQERETFDSLGRDIAGLEAEIADLKELQSMQAKSAVPVSGTDPKKASDARGGTNVIQVTSNLPKGTGFTRYVMALAASRGNRGEALQFAKRWERDSPEVVQVLKAAVDAGTTTDATWAAPLVVYNNLASEFIELLRPATIIGKISGFRRVPFNVSMPRQTAGSTVGWVGQAKPKPVGELAFDTVSLGMAKAAGIIVIAEELARSSDPSAEMVISTDLRNAIAEFLDAQFIDPSVAAVANVSPAAVTNGASVIDSTGTTAAAFRTDFAAALAVWSAADLSISGGVVVMTETQAMRLGMIVNAFGQPEFPGIGAGGGSIFGMPVVTSENIPAEGGSPAGNRIVLLKPGEIFMADNGGIVVDVSREASVQMNTAPDDPATASTVHVSFWQNNLVGIRAERFINWLKRRSAAAVIIEGAVYTGA
jgi:HK97 family phage major capsid protein